jgi:hypothetical protein
MDGKTLQLKTIDTVGRQLEKAVEGLAEGHWNEKLHENSMSPLEAFEHLAACCDMFCVEARGEKKGWGEYSVPNPTRESVMAAWKEERAKAIELLTASDKDEDLNHAADYISLHDAYHVGQIVSLRIKLQPDWDSYAIYS